MWEYPKCFEFTARRAPGALGRVECGGIRITSVLLLRKPMNLDRVTSGRSLPDDFNVKVVGWDGAGEARAEIMAGVARYQQARPQPKFWK